MNGTSLKMLALGLFLLTTVAVGTMNVDAGGQQFNKKQKLSDIFEQEKRPAATRGDCSFLSDPKFLGDPRGHIHELSDATMRAAYMPKAFPSNSQITSRNYIDDEIFGKMSRDGVPSAPLSTDEEFLRRVTLDLTGHIPTPDQVRRFLADNSKDKRDRLIDSLIGSAEYVDRWTMWMGDLLKNNVFASTTIPRFPQGRNAFYNTIKQAIQKNTPYNQ